MRNKYCLAAMLLAMGLTACTTASRADRSGMSFASTPQLGKIVWRDLITEDLGGAKRFYQGLFGWTFENSKGPGGQEYAVARSGNIYVAGMVEVAAATDGSKLSRWLPYVSVADVDEAVAIGIATGAQVAVSAREVSFGRVAALVDPEGAVIGLARSSVGDPDDRTTAPVAGRPVWTELLTDNPAAAADFYRALGGYEVSTFDRRRGQYTILASDGKFRAGILEKPAEEIKPVWLTYFGVDDPEAAAVLAESLGGKIILPASPELRDGNMAVVTDPSGAVLVLQNWMKMEGVE